MVANFSDELPCVTRENFVTAFDFAIFPGIETEAHGNRTRAREILQSRRNDGNFSSCFPSYFAAVCCCSAGGRLQQDNLRFTKRQR